MKNRTFRLQNMKNRTFRLQKLQVWLYFMISNHIDANKHLQDNCMLKLYCQTRGNWLLLLIATRITAHLPSCCRFPQGRSSNCPKKIKFCTYRRSSEALLCRKPEFHRIPAFVGVWERGGEQKKNEKTLILGTRLERWVADIVIVAKLALPHPTQIRTK